MYRLHMVVSHLSLLVFGKRWLICTCLEVELSSARSAWRSVTCEGVLWSVPVHACPSHCMHVQVTACTPWHAVQASCRFALVEVSVMMDYTLNPAATAGPVLLLPGTSHHSRHCNQHPPSHQDPAWSTAQHWCVLHPVGPTSLQQHHQH